MSEVRQGPHIEVITGNTAAAYGALLSRVQVIAIFPITPQTTISEKLASLIAEGKLKAKILLPESEHSVMAGCIGAAATGARTFTATSSQGLLLMHELLHWASGYRLPIVMAVCNRATASPWNAWCDHSDSLAQRDTGWLQLYCENNQEVLDTIIIAYRVAEELLLPVMVNLDGFILSHTAEPVEVPSQELVDRFLPPYQPKYKLDPDNPYTIGCVVGPEWFMEIKYRMQEAMEQGVEVIERAEAEFFRLFGRRYGLIEEYRCEDAELALVAYATIASTAREAVDELRERGERVGLIKIKSFRPFPTARLREAAGKFKKLVVLDRNISIGHEGVFYQELKSALYHLKDRPQVLGFVLGLGGRDVTPEDIKGIVETAREREWSEEEVITWNGLRR